MTPPTDFCTTLTRRCWTHSLHGLLASSIVSHLQFSLPSSSSHMNTTSLTISWTQTHLLSSSPLHIHGGIKLRALYNVLHCTNRIHVAPKHHTVRIRFSVITYTLTPLFRVNELWPSELAIRMLQCPLYRVPEQGSCHGMSRCRQYSYANNFHL